MSLLATQIREMRQELAVLKTATCEVRYAPDLAPGSSYDCHYEMTAPKTGEPIDFEAGNGYGYTVWFHDDPNPPLDSRDNVIVDGLTISVQKVPERGNLSAFFRIEGVVR